MLGLSHRPIGCVLAAASLLVAGVGQAADETVQLATSTRQIEKPRQGRPGFETLGEWLGRMFGRPHPEAERVPGTSTSMPSMPEAVPEDSAAVAPEAPEPSPEASIVAQPSASHTTNPPEPRPRSQMLPVEAAVVAAVEAQPSEETRVAFREVDALRREIAKYYVYSGDRSDPDATVTVRLKLDRSGRIAGKPALVESNGGTEKVRDTLYGSARRALLRADAAGTFTQLPAEKYDRWKRMDIVFSTEKVGFP